MANIVIVDTGTSNIASVVNALKYVGVVAHVSNKLEEVARADKIILPGVGAFSAGFGALVDKGLVEILRAHALKDKKPMLGICLGMQMLATISEEGGEHAGLNLIPGRVRLLKVDQPGFRVPNIGWCDVHPLGGNSLFQNDPAPLAFYHVHSYYFDCVDKKHIVGTIKFSGKDVPVMVQNEKIFGVQFHPEKSQDNGLDFINNFLKI
jgi:glutamine amidotransferase